LIPYGLDVDTLFVANFSHPFFSNFNLPSSFFFFLAKTQTPHHLFCSFFSVETIAVPPPYLPFFFFLSLLFVSFCSFPG